MRDFSRPAIWKWPDTDDVTSFQSSINLQMHRNKEVLLTQVMEAYLKRPPTLEDAKGFCFIRHEKHPDVEYFGLADGTVLGTIDLSFDTDPQTFACKYTWTFEPAPT